jgi:hypothetical protein
MSLLITTSEWSGKKWHQSREVFSRLCALDSSRMDVTRMASLHTHHKATREKKIRWLKSAVSSQGKKHQQSLFRILHQLLKTLPHRPLRAMSCIPNNDVFMVGILHSVLEYKIMHVCGSPSEFKRSNSVEIQEWRIKNIAVRHYYILRETRSLLGRCFDIKDKPKAARASYLPVNIQEV